MPIDLPDDELIDMPAENLRPGELTRAFIVQAEHRKKQEETVIEQSSITALQRRHEEEDYEKREFEQREEALLANLHEREREILEEAEQLDARTIKLDDGRRAYVDRDTYRDAEGRELEGADRAQAEQHHLDQPNAATWQEHQAIEQKMKETERLRHQVEDLKSAPDSAALTRYEKEFARQNMAQLKDAKELPDYGSDDIALAFGLSKSFQTATTAPIQEMPRGLPTPPLATPAPTAARLAV